MTRKTHTAGAALAGAGLALYANISSLESAVLVFGALATAMIPDWDRVLDSGPNHRSITHSFIIAGGFAVLVAVLAVSVFGFAEVGGNDAGVSEIGTRLAENPRSLVGTFAVGGAAGYVSHLLLDSLTGKRIWLLFPGGPRFGLPLFETGKFGELVFGAGILGLLGLTLINMIGITA